MASVILLILEKMEQEKGKSNCAMEEDKRRLLEATGRADIDAIRTCLRDNPSAIEATDENGNNAMHLCVLAGAAVRAPELIKFFLEETTIDLLHKNRDGLDPLRVALTLNDSLACDMLDVHWKQQLMAKNPSDQRTDPSLVIPLPDDRTPS